jgi:hypothetical protein
MRRLGFPRAPLALLGRYLYGDFGPGPIWTVSADAPGQPQEISERYVVDLSGAVGSS